MHEDRIDLFTADEVKRAKKIMQGSLIAMPTIRDQIVTEEVMERINRETGQQNHRDYMAYRLEHIAIQN